MIPLELRRRFYAEEIEATSALRSPAVVDALAAVPRERFVRPGPWTVRSEADFQSPPRRTPDADARHVYHNVAIALDPARQLFNGAPGLVAMVIDRLELQRGDRVAHVGCATGYYTAVIAHCVGPTGRVLAVEVDDTLAAEARANLASLPWVDVKNGDGQDVGGGLDALLINAGVTHPLDAWLDAVKPGGRIAIPLTMALTPAIGKGLIILLTRSSDPMSFDARVVGFAAIYNAAGIRDEALGRAIGAAMQKQPFPALQRLRRDRHEPAASCWLHRDGACLSTG